VAVNYVAGSTGFSHRRFFALDAVACLTWVGYSIGIGVLASSFPWLHNNPLLSAGIAVVFAVVLGVILDHLLRLWHKHLARKDARKADEWLDGGASGATKPSPGTAELLAPGAGDGDHAVTKRLA
jgi:membrane-associated protein